APHAAALPIRTLPRGVGLLPWAGDVGPDPLKPPEPFEDYAPVVTPPEVLCAVSGHTPPFDDSCTQRSLAVFADKDKKTELASFFARSIDVTWGFGAGSSSSTWVDVRDGGIVLTGYADASKEVFALNREVSVAGGHVSFITGAPVLVRNGTKRGAKIS